MVQEKGTVIAAFIILLVIFFGWVFILSVILEWIRKKRGSKNE